jgi:hypothetical protein
MLEISVNERNMTAWTSWSWAAPREDWSPYWGSLDRLPNGDWLADFGDESHYLPGSGIGSPLPNSTGAVLVEVNPNGEVVRTYTFPYAWGIYRVVPIPMQTINDYDGTMHTSDFTIDLTTLNNLGASTNIYYSINGGPTETVATDGQPRITTQGANNTLEYWSVDSNGIEELPHNVLTGINLQKSVGTSASTGAMLLPPISASNIDMTLEIAAVVIAVVAILFAVIVDRKRSQGRK